MNFWNTKSIKKKSKNVFQMFQNAMHMLHEEKNI